MGAKSNQNTNRQFRRIHNIIRHNPVIHPFTILIKPHPQLQKILIQPLRRLFHTPPLLPLLLLTFILEILRILYQGLILTHAITQ
jgi:hypothetical protein